MNELKLPGWAEDASRTVTVDGVETHYLELGDGPDLILIHGGGPGADSWGNWRACLPEYAKNFRVIAYDMPGFGRSAKPSPDTYAYDQASRNRHLTGLIETLKLAPVSVIGNSMGGATSLGVCIERPELVGKLVLMGSAGLAISNPDPTAKATLRRYDYTLEAMRAVMQTLTGSRFKVEDEVLQYRHALMQDPAAQAAITRIARSDLTYPEEQIAAVKTPTLVVAGKEDKIAVPARNVRYLELLENSWGVFIPHAGHWVMMETPKLFVDVTTRFLLEDWEE
ncbi:Alpha/beta hydrolase [Caballeronia arvi]|uniref:Alpha/beta hydrolase n=1 Tax=Caballeronia arvi TaxID=1777135 RepID=A0A158KI58_9BURK|nr:alpha/beta hydrolase [Caballeronia arvi]SAL80828.1 Alpha/beta hydrolase [Caballeronia arvi]